MTATVTKTFEYDASFQRKIARTLFQDPDFALTTASHLKAEHFQSPTYRWIVETLLDYANTHGSGIAMDALKIELSNATKRGAVMRELQPKIAAALVDLKKPVSDRTYVKEEIFRFVKRQTAVESVLAAVEHINKHDWSGLDTALQRVLDVQTSLENGLGTMFVGDIKERTKQRKSFKRNGIATGLRVDDYLKPGGLPPKTLGVVVAPSGKGKSFCLVHIGKSAVLESRAKVLHITLELSEEAILDRYDAAFTGVALNQLEAERLTVRDKVKDLGTQFGEFLIVKEFPPGVLTANALQVYLRHLERKAFYPDLIIVDYADLMIPSKSLGKNTTSYEDMGGVYTELRSLAYTANAPIWTASQTQRNALNKETIDLDSIADSFKKAMIADLVICLSQTLEEKETKHARFFVAKNRLGSDKFDFRVRLDWAHATIEDLQMAEDATIAGTSATGEDTNE